MNVRIKHTDSTATISHAISGPDKRGGYLIDHAHLEMAQLLGWRVSHAKHDVSATTRPADDPDDDPAGDAVDAAQDAADDGSKPGRGRIGPKKSG